MALVLRLHIFIQYMCPCVLGSGGGTCFSSNLLYRFIQLGFPNVFKL